MADLQKANPALACRLRSFDTVQSALKQLRGVDTDKGHGSHKPMGGRDEWNRGSGGGGGGVNDGGRVRGSTHNQYTNTFSSKDTSRNGNGNGNGNGQMNKRVRNGNYEDGYSNSKDRGNNTDLDGFAAYQTDNGQQQQQQGYRNVSSSASGFSFSTSLRDSELAQAAVRGSVTHQPNPNRGGNEYRGVRDVGDVRGAGTLDGFSMRRDVDEVRLGDGRYPPGVVGNQMAVKTSSGNTYSHNSGRSNVNNYNNDNSNNNYYNDNSNSSSNNDNYNNSNNNHDDNNDNNNKNTNNKSKKEVGRGSVASAEKKRKREEGTNWDKSDQDRWAAHDDENVKNNRKNNLSNDTDNINNGNGRKKNKKNNDKFSNDNGNDDNNNILISKTYKMNKNNNMNNKISDQKAQTHKLKMQKLNKNNNNININLNNSNTDQRVVALSISSNISISSTITSNNQQIRKKGNLSNIDTPGTRTENPNSGASKKKNAVTSSSHDNNSKKVKRVVQRDSFTVRL